MNKSKHTRNEPNHPDKLPTELTDKQIMDYTDAGQLALCMFCGAMTWREDLGPDEKCKCGGEPYLYGKDYTEWGNRVKGIRAGMGREEAQEALEELSLELDIQEQRRGGGLSEMTELGKFGDGEGRSKPVHDPEREFTSGMGRAIYEMRELLGLSQSQLAEAIGCHRNTISNLESGRVKGVYKDTRLRLWAAAIKVGRRDLEKVFRS